MIKEIILDNEDKVIEISDISNLNIELLNNANLILKLLNLNNAENIKILANIGYNSQLKVIFADFSRNDITLNTTINLNDRLANCEWHLATLANNKYKKTFDVSFNHVVGETKALMDNYGVACGESKIIFAGISHIYEKASKANTVQNAKIIVFDQKAIGVASPILKIDENDVIASHGAVVGRLNDDHLFYLMSRGLSKDDARGLITRGYLEPISKEFSPKLKDKINDAIKEAM